MSLGFGRLYNLSEEAETNHFCPNMEKWIILVIQWNRVGSVGELVL
jgi:hypothetical protein